MNKAELVDAIAEKTEATKAETDVVVTTLIECNPQTGETIKIPATTVPAFSAGKGFKTLVATA